MVPPSYSLHIHRNMEIWSPGTRVRHSGSSVTKIYDADDDDAQHGLEDGHKVAYIWAANDSSQVTINKILGLLYRVFKHFI